MEPPTPLLLDLYFYYSPPQQYPLPPPSPSAHDPYGCHPLPFSASYLLSYTNFLSSSTWNHQQQWQYPSTPPLQQLSTIYPHYPHHYTALPTYLQQHQQSVPYVFDEMHVRGVSSQREVEAVGKKTIDSEKTDVVANARGDEVEDNIADTPRGGSVISYGSVMSSSSYEQSRVEKLGSMNWCRRCKVDCMTMEGLVLHSLTSEHQNMTMALVLRIKQKMQSTTGYASTGDNMALVDTLQMQPGVEDLKLGQHQSLIADSLSEKKIIDSVAESGLREYITTEDGSRQLVNDVKVTSKYYAATYEVIGNNGFKNGGHEDKVLGHIRSSRMKMLGCDQLSEGRNSENGQADHRVAPINQNHTCTSLGTSVSGDSVSDSVRRVVRLLVRRDADNAHYLLLHSLSGVAPEPIEIPVFKENLVVGGVTENHETLVDEVDSTSCEGEAKGKELAQVDEMYDDDLKAYKGEGSGNEYLINLIDSPGHVDFSSEVDAALQITDDALAVADCTEGVYVQLETILWHALGERIRSVLTLDKMDRCFLELPVEDPLLGVVQVYSEEGNVAFSVGFHGWAFTLTNFANKYASKLRVNEGKMMKRLWGENFFDPATKKRATKNIGSTTCKKSLVFRVWNPGIMQTQAGSNSATCKRGLIFWVWDPGGKLPVESMHLLNMQRISGYIPCV